MEIRQLTIKLSTCVDTNVSGRGRGIEEMLCILGQNPVKLLKKQQVVIYTPYPYPYLPLDSRAKAYQKSRGII